MNSTMRLFALSLGIWLSICGSSLAEAWTCRFDPNGKLKYFTSGEVQVVPNGQGPTIVRDTVMQSVGVDEVYVRRIEASSKRYSVSWAVAGIAETVPNPGGNVRALSTTQYRLTIFRKKNKARLTMSPMDAVIFGNRVISLGGTCAKG